MRKLIMLAFLAIVAVVAYAGEYVGMFHGSETIRVINPKQLVTFTPASEVDSFLYVDTINDTIFEWRSQVQTVILTLDSIDTAHTYTVKIAYASNDTVTASYDPTLTATEDTIRIALVAALDALDSLSAEDSTTYIKIFDIFSGVTHGGRWNVVIDTSYVDSASHSGNATKEMVVDTMAALIQANVSLDSVITTIAYDTNYTIESDTGGLLFTFLTDTAQDTSTTTTGLNIKTTRDSAYLPNSMSISGITGNVIVGASAYTTGDFGDSDGVCLVLASYIGGYRKTLCSTMTATIPGTLAVNAHNDSLFLEFLFIDVISYDSIAVADGDTASYTLSWKLKTWFFQQE